MSAEPPPLPERLARSAQVDRRGSVNMTPRESYEFAVKLATDDEFRQRLESNPLETLAEHHIYLPPHEMKSAVRLPAKEDVLNAIEGLTVGKEFRVALIPDAVPDLIIFAFFIVWL